VGNRAAGRLLPEKARKFGPHCGTVSPHEKLILADAYLKTKEQAAEAPSFVARISAGTTISASEFRRDALLYAQPFVLGLPAVPERGWMTDSRALSGYSGFVLMDAYRSY
jgi:hypothetical protein